MAVSSAAMSLRDSFGDRKLDISRKITACVACRKQKIKCHLNGNPPCSRCKSRGLPCTVNKSLQMILESDAGWKETMEDRMRRLEELVGTNHQDFAPSSTSEPSASSPTVINGTMELTNNTSTPISQSSEASDVTLNLSCTLGSFPGSSIISLTFTENGSQSKHKPDLISTGLISLEAAEVYFTVYQKSMEPCTAQVLTENDCLANVRARSSLLTAAICTVGSFSADSASHRRCYDSFMQEVSSRLFSRHSSVDDVRALCIGALWLNKVSSILIGMAVRIANDMNLHRCITKMPHSKTECYERTRLYFLVYICDHQCSLTYGKPPMTRDFHTLKNPKAFLQSPHCISADGQLISEVELWSISSRAFDIFGADVEASITTERRAELESLSQSFDLCRSTVPEPAARIDQPTPFSEQLFDLHIHCAKLSLFSHSFRGSNRRQARSVFDGKEKFERRALDSAMSVVRSVAFESELQLRLEWLPSYFGTMIAFASIFLIKASERKEMMCYLDKSEVLVALNTLVAVFKACSARIQPEHPLRSVARSLRIAMNRLCESGINHIGSLANGMLSFGNVDNSWEMDYLGDYSDLFSFTDGADQGLSAM